MGCSKLCLQRGVDLARPVLKGLDFLAPEARRHDLKEVIELLGVAWGTDNDHRRWRLRLRHCGGLRHDAAAPRAVRRRCRRCI